MKRTTDIRPIFEIKLSRQFSRWALFGPGICLVLLGIFAVLAPKLVIATIAIFLVSVGLLLVYGAYKVMEIRRNAEKILKDITGRLSVRQVVPGAPTEIFTGEDFRSPGDKKITWH